VFGDWVVWSDFRNAMFPAPTANFTDRSEIFAYHIPTRRIVPVLTGHIQSGISHFFDDGRLTVQCRDDMMWNRFTRAVSIPMPSLPDD
jgi:hypothetical protein